MNCQKLILGWFVFFSVSAHGADPCRVLRGVIDIGSGSTKLRVARVDRCLQRIEKLLITDQSIKVSYSADLKQQKEKSGRNEFSPEVQAQGLKAIQELVARGNKVAKDIVWRGVATSAFRTSENGKTVLEKFSEQLKMPMTVITQDKEGALGFLGGIQFAKSKDPKKILVWDIGGGSQQFIFRKEKELSVLKLEEKASEKFRERVLNEVKKITDPAVRSPNPIGEKNIDPSFKIAQSFAEGVKLPFQPSEVIGVGGVHSLAIPAALGRKLNEFSADDLARATKRLVKMTDAELKNDYADTLVTNVILVHGMMTAFGFKKIRVSPYGTAEGSLVYPEFWD